MLVQPNCPSSLRFRYETARNSHQGDWVNAGEQAVFARQCKLKFWLYGLSVLAFWLYAGIFNSPRIVFVGLGSFVCLGLAIYKGYAQRDWYSCARILVAGVWATVTAAALVDGRLASPLLWMLPMAPLVAGYMLNKHSWLISTLLSCGTVVGIYVLGFYVDEATALVRSDLDLAVYRGIALAIFVIFGLIASIHAQREMSMVHDEELKLKRVRKACETAIVAKSRFLANMSHEIRTPMHGIVGTTAILQRLDLNSTERDAADTIYNCGEALLALLTNVLDYSKLEAKKLRIHARGFQPSSVLHRIASQWRPRMERRNIKLETKIDCDDATFVQGDPELLVKVASYLMDNAVRYGLQAPVELGLSCRRGGELSGYALELWVHDRGPGIVESELDRLRLPFERGRGLDGDNIEGIGLGLALAHELAELMGGRLSLESQEGCGLRVTLSVQLAQAEIQGQSAPANDRVVEERQGVRVLVVDDQLVNLTIARAELESLNCEVDTAKCGKEAITKAARAPYDLILMDLELPDLSGSQAASRIMGQEGPNQKTPIVALSAHDPDRVRALIADSGMVGSLAKPFSEGQLLDLLEEHCADPLENAA